MQRMILIALLLDFSVGAVATSCAAGRKHKDTLTNLFCANSATDAASCDTDCCVADDKTCGGQTSACPFDKYAPVTDAWKAIKTTTETAAADCCLPKVKCQNTLFSCPAGMKKKGAAVADVKCASDPASCAVGDLCCERDPATCGGYAAAATACGAATQYHGSDDAWKKIAVTAGNLPSYHANCCAAKATCATYTCPAGKKKATGAGVPATVCTTDGGATCGAADEGTCCAADTDTCGGSAAPSCAADHYYPGNDEWKAMPNTQCCTAKATCAVAKCPAGYKKKANVDNLSCTGNADSCATGTTCCEANTATCGGLTDIACPYGFFDESTLWTSKTTEATKDAWKNKAATEATKNTACCTAKAACKNPFTTTPAPVVTTTPATPVAVRRYSENEMAIKAQPQGTNMVWLGLGCFMGMAVLMVAQGVRSRFHAEAVESDAREVAELLENSQ